jgi:hypothetical protein
LTVVDLEKVQLGQIAERALMIGNDEALPLALKRHSFQRSK